MSTKSKTLTVLGTSTGVGKTLIVAALCRILHQDGLSVSPFKAINISLNSGVTKDEGEMATSQIVQAEASQIEPDILMNPVLIKPQKNKPPQFILMGKLAPYQKPNQLWPLIKTSFDKIQQKCQVVVIEGAGSPTELSFISSDQANLGIAKHAKSPIIIVADIDRGGAFASLVGTISILKKNDPQSASQIKGFILNKYQGETKSLSKGLRELTEITGIPVLGVVPFLENHQIADEDTWSWTLKPTLKKNTVLDIVVIQFPTLQNSHDFDPLIQEPGVGVRFIKEPQSFGTPDLIILGGCKNTIEDLKWLRKTGFEQLIIKHADSKPVIGICGGFQMLGESIKDPNKVESFSKLVKGLGLLPVTTTFSKTKITRQTSGHISQNYGLLKGARDLEVKGYEIHMGRTINNSGPFVLDQSGRVAGSYYHGVFNNSLFRKLLLSNLAKQIGVVLPKSKALPGDKYDLLAQKVRESIDMGLLMKILERQI